jgi:hypothetical protein
LREENADGAAGGGAAATDNAAAMAALQAQIDALKTETAAKDAQIAEKDQAAVYWHEQYKGKATASDKTPVADEGADPGLDPIEALSKGGMKAFESMLTKSGYVKQVDIEKLTDSKIEARANRMTVEAELAREFPELNDSKSEFFKEVVAEYKAMTAQGTPEIVAMKQAARSARLAQIEAGKVIPKAEQEERQRRADAAGGDKSRKTPAKEEAENEELDEFQKNICKQMGVSEEKYKEIAKKGIVYERG